MLLSQWSLKIFGKPKKYGTYFFNFPAHFDQFLTAFRFIRYSVANPKN